MKPTALEMAAMGFLAVGIMRIFQTLFARANQEAAKSALQDGVAPPRD